MFCSKPSVRFSTLASLLLLMIAASSEIALSEETAAESHDTVAAGNGGGNAAEGDASEATASKPKYPAFKDFLKDATAIDGLIRLHRKDDKLYGEISSGLLNTDLIVVISIARGISEAPLFGGMSWGFGDDWIWQFRKVDDRIQIIRRNVRFRADKGTPLERAVYLAYTDSVLFSLPIKTTSPSGAYVVDLSPVFMSDLPQISRLLRGFSFSRDKSSWAAVKGFRDNVELQVAATYSSSGNTSFDTVADSRGVGLHIHYSISKLPQTGYQSRVADDRVGYFLTVLKDFSVDEGYERFVRYINRWDLQKAESKAKLSPPKTPIIFWIEKTVPFKYRGAVREGILAWNKAFEKAGYSNAIEVRQQPDDATWDPEDINYNTFRWITASASFAIGPSRVNPTTGQILDADILFDADFVQYWKESYEVMTAQKVAELTGGPLTLHDYEEQLTRIPPQLRQSASRRCDCTRCMARQLAFGTMMLNAEAPTMSKDDFDKIVLAGVKSVVMHEVGHTLGLRHNFKASTFLTLDEINDPAKTAEVGLAASIMDYLPVNISPDGKKQGDFFSHTIGPYDLWAIEYGYKPDLSEEELQKIASRQAEPALHYATDEDTRGIDPDPLSNRFDLGKDPLQYCQRRVELIAKAWPKLVERLVGEGDGYQRARRAFNILLGEHGQAMYFAARFVGGIHVHRDHKGDPNARPPFVVVPHKKQREALALLEKHVFGREAFQFPPELYNHLAPSFWRHWGTSLSTRPDYPVHETILLWQDRILYSLLSPLTLQRLIDSELKVPQNKEVFTAAELLERLTAAIFAETEQLQGGEFTNRKPAINSLRRALQRRYLQRLSNIAMGNMMAPEDCQAVAYSELESLEARLKQVLAGKAQLDTYTRAHLSESAARIRKVLDARLQLRSP